MSKILVQVQDINYRPSHTVRLINAALTHENSIDKDDGRDFLAKKEWS